MRINAIFEVFKPTLYAVHFDYERQSTELSEDDATLDSDPSIPHEELAKAFQNWRDAGLLWTFFSTYRQDLLSYDSTCRVSAAVKLTIAQARDFKAELFRIISSKDENKLNELFQPLDNREMGEIGYEFQHLKVKRLHSKSWLRLYAVKYRNAFVITGSAIKLTHKMNRPHLQEEIYKLNLVSESLKGDGHKCSFVYLDI